MDFLSGTSFWWHGPSFLKHDELQWPTNPHKNKNYDLPEMVTTFHINQFSSFSTIQRIVAYILHTLYILRHTQQESIPKERKLLLSKQNLPYKNRLLSLTPFMDSEGIICVGLVTRTMAIMSSISSLHMESTA